MKTIIAIIEKSDTGGYGIYSSNINGLFGYGNTEEEAKNEFRESIDSQIEFFYHQNKEVPNILYADISYQYDKF